MIEKNLLKRYCKCGCGREIVIRSQHKYTGIPDYILGHSSKGRTGENNPMYDKKHTEESKEKNRQKHLGKTHTKETIDKIRLAMTGENHPNYGEKLTKETKEKMRLLNVGKNNPAWLGGISFESYGMEFNSQLKAEIRKRDNHKCQLCGVPEIECLKKLCIHHLDYNKKNNSDVNLISLCNNCHSRTNINRKYWEEYFTQLMISKIRVKKI